MNQKILELLLRMMTFTDIKMPELPLTLIEQSTIMIYISFLLITMPI